MLCNRMLRWHRRPAADRTASRNITHFLRALRWDLQISESPWWIRGILRTDSEFVWGWGGLMWLSCLLVMRIKVCSVLFFAVGLTQPTWILCLRTCRTGPLSPRHPPSQPYCSRRWSLVHRLIPLTLVVCLWSACEPCLCTLLRKASGKISC